MTKEQENQFWEWIYSLPLERYLTDIYWDLYLDDVFPRVEIPEKNSIVVRDKMEQRDK